MSLTAQVLKCCFDRSAPVLVTREPGLGTTAMIEEAAALAQRELIHVEPALDGLFCTFSLQNAEPLKRALAATVPTVLFIDGLDRASPLLLQDFVTLIRTRRVGGLEGPALPDNVTIVVTGERDTEYRPLRAIRPYVEEYWVKPHNR